MKVCVALDDFSEEIMTDSEWSCLFKLKDIYPQLRVTMFTIPEQCSDEWLQEIRELYPWIEHAVHGTDHKFVKSQIPDGLLEGFTDWYKAPRWELTHDEYLKLRNIGYKVATNKTNDFKGEYVYDEGKTVIKDICYELPDGIFSWHGHVQSQAKRNKVNPNGLPDVIKLFLSTIPKDAEFVWVSEIR